MQVVDIGRAVRLEQALLGGLQERVAGAAPPEVGLGVGGFGAQLRTDFAGALVGLLHLDAGLAREGRGGRLAPAHVGAAQRVDGALRGGLRRPEQESRAQAGGGEGTHGVPGGE
ncbi:hypothetical protein D3C84_992820 [compost metagenome]